MGSRGVSQIGTAPFPQIAQRFVGQRVESAGSDVFFELPIPNAGVELGKPGAERGEVLGRELAHGAFDLLDVWGVVRARWGEEPAAEKWAEELLGWRLEDKVGKVIRAIERTYLRFAQTAPPGTAACVLITADQRLLLAAQAEGLLTLNPETFAVTGVPAFLATL